MFAVVLRARGRDLQLPPPQPLLGPSRDGPLGTQWFGQHWEGRPGSETVRPIEGNACTLWEWSWGQWESLGARQRGGTRQSSEGMGQGSETLLLTQLRVCAHTFSWAVEGASSICPHMWHPPNMLCVWALVGPYGHSWIPPLPPHTLLIALLPLPIAFF